GSPGTACTSSARKTMSRTATRNAIPIRLIRYWSTTPPQVSGGPLCLAEVPGLVEAGGLQRRLDCLLAREVGRRPCDPDDVRLLDVASVVRGLLPVAHGHPRGQERPGQAPLAVERGRQNRGHVDRSADRTAHVDVLQVRVSDVHADPAVIERRTRVDSELRVR